VAVFLGIDVAWKGARLSTNRMTDHLIGGSGFVSSATSFHLCSINLTFSINQVKMTSLPLIGLDCGLFYCRVPDNLQTLQMLRIRIRGVLRKVLAPCSVKEGLAVSLTQNDPLTGRP
jgi:hypothetical protein